MASLTPYLGSIDFWPANNIPEGYTKCMGQVLPVSQNQALYALIGNYFGGNSPSTFALPDFRGRIPIGLKPSLAQFNKIGNSSSQSKILLLPSNIPVHIHTPPTLSMTGNLSFPANNTAGGSDSPGNCVPGFDEGNSPQIYATTSDNTTLAPAAITLNIQISLGAVGAGKAIDILPPYVVMNYIIATAGIYPTPD